MVIRSCVLRVVIIFLIQACTSNSAQAQNLTSDNDTPIPGTFRPEPSDLYALRQLWNAWNQTPDVQTNLAGWNALANDSADSQLRTPCVPDSPWRGVFCNAKTSSPQTAESNNTVWDLEITSLVLSNAALSGVIPDAIGNLSNLVTLSLIENPGLTGPLPLGLENLRSLFDLDVHGNNITGKIPQWKQGAFVFLQNINLADNQMTGGLPLNQTTSFRAVQTFNMSHNLLSGDFHVIDLFSYIHKAVSVDLSHNEFSGSMPFLINFTWQGYSAPVTGPLTHLDLSSNQFNDTLPEITGHKTLQHFNVSNNLLKGSLDPALMSDVPTLKTMDLSNNLFTGSIPNLASLSNLQHLVLSYNNFDPGPFPSWTTDLSSLQTLILQGVSLTGDVPSAALANFKSLETLGLDDNNLTGTLDLNSLLAVPNRNHSLRLVSLTNNQIGRVAYSGRIVNLTIKFDLAGNPYCNNSTAAINDVSRCVCLQQCADTPGAPSNKKVIIVTTVISASILAVVISVYSYLFWRSRKERYQLILEAEQKFAEYEVKPTIYTYTELQFITRVFSMKLGHGAFGAVYKGTLPNGCEVAVKQLFAESQQSLDDFLNEIVLVAAVKHRNLVKLKGCCIRKNQRLLVYEFVENGDLDQFLFGQDGIERRSWTTRQKICYGVAEGIHYLHFASQPKIIHRDIKACNILLDRNLEPKIADFGLALLYPEEESHIMTIHVAGTRGYLAPEYAHLGYLSDKVDVFSFGVLLLEIVSGRRNMQIWSPEDYFYLPDWAWGLHIEGRFKELIDRTLELQKSEETEVLRIMNIALLCVHRSGESRPDMKAVMAMLHGGMDAEIATLVQEHETDRIRSSDRSQLSLGRSTTDSSFTERMTSSLMPTDYQSSSMSQRTRTGSALENQKLYGNQHNIG